MTFAEKIVALLEQLDCTSNDLANKSNISSATISRYKHGERTPDIGSRQLEDLINGFIELGKEKNVILDKNTLLNELNKILQNENGNFLIIKENFNKLYKTLNFNLTDLALSINYDPSYLYKIKSGNRKPKNARNFVVGISKFIVQNYDNLESKLLLSELLKINIEENISLQYYEEKIADWILNNINDIDYSNEIHSFLTKMDHFDLEQYIKDIKFDKIKIITSPVKINKEKTYYGMDGYKKSQLDTLKLIILNKNSSDIFFYSNITIMEASKDLTFLKKFMIGLAMLLKKGININIIHDLDRPFEELLLGLEAWIPLYMTGQINPYYLDDYANEIYSTLELSNNIVSLFGFNVKNDMGNARFRVSTKKEDVETHKNNAKTLINNAKPLMKIYNQNNSSEYYSFLKEINNKNIDILQFYSNLPIHIMSLDLLNDILNKNNIIDKDKKMIINYIQKEQMKFKEYINSNKMIDSIVKISKQEFEQNEVLLNLSGIFYENKIKYTYEQYEKHLEQIKDFKHKNYTLKFEENYIFKNINISIYSNKMVMISKTNHPSIHFVIYHPTLVNAITNFKPTIIEK